MITTISAFMVKTTPIEAFRVRNMLTRTPPAATSAPPSAKAKAGTPSNSQSVDGRW
jgi:hypothetical protein